jgi:hypothetical protein
MRNILVLCCAFLSSFCMAIPFVFPANLGNLVAIDEFPHIHMETPHTAVGSLRDVNSDGQDKRAMLHDARGCFFSTNAQDDGGNNAKLGHETHNVASRCMNARSNVRLLSRRHNGSVRKGHKVLATGTSSKSTVTNTDGPHWFRVAYYRRSPMPDLPQGIGHPSITSTRTESPSMKATPTPSNHIKKLRERPVQSQGSEGSRPDGWRAYMDWKQ